LTVTGQIIAQTLNVQQVTSSIIYSSGSNNFGCDLNSRQTFTGSVLITGSLTIAGASSATSYSGTTIYGSSVVCSAVGKFSTCIDAGSGTFSGALGGTSATFSGNGAFSGVLQVAPTTGTGIIGVGDNFGGNMNAGIYRGGLGVTTSGNYLNVGGYDGVVITTGAVALGSQTVRLTISSTGVATFACQVCAPRINVSNTSTVLLVEGTATNGEASINLSGKNSSGTVRDAVLKYDNTDVIRLGTSSNIGMQFETNDVARFRLTSTGIACFACQVCAPSFKGGTIYGTAGYFSCHIELNDNGSGWIYGVDKNHSIILRGDRTGCVADFTNYYQYGGNLSTGKGHNFWTDGVLASQTIKMQIANNGICMTVPLYVCNSTNSRSFQTIAGGNVIGPYGTCTLLYLSTALAGTYIINASFGPQGIDIYGGMLIVVANGGSFRVITNGSGTRSAITLSGCAVQLTNALGVTLEASAQALFIGGL
jgi:hypothetical protein